MTTGLFILADVALLIEAERRAPQYPDIVQRVAGIAVEAGRLWNHFRSAA